MLPVRIEPLNLCNRFGSMSRFDLFAYLLWWSTRHPLLRFVEVEHFGKILEQDAGVWAFYAKDRAFVYGDQLFVRIEDFLIFRANISTPTPRSPRLN